MESAASWWHLKFARLSSAYRARLLTAATALYHYLRAQHVGSVDRLMRSARRADDLLHTFVRHTCDVPTPRAIRLAKHAVLYCQLVWPRLRHSLPETWAALRMLEDLHPKRVRVPLPFPLLVCMVVASRLLSCRLHGRSAREWLLFACLLEVGFFAMLRPGELLQLRARDVGTLNSLALGFPHCTLRIAKPKNRRSVGPEQFVQLTHPCACMWLTYFVNSLAPDELLWPLSATAFRQKFHAVCAHLRIQGCRLTPASLRAGGASYWFQSGVTLGALKFLGRWASESSLFHYIQFATAQQLLLRVPADVTQSLQRLLKHAFFVVVPSAQVLSALHAHQRLPVNMRCPDSTVTPAAAVHAYGQLASGL